MSSAAMSGDKTAKAPFFVNHATLYLPPPYTTRSISNVITLYNRSDTRSCVFKVRTVDPDKYIVRPTINVVGPLAATRITITLKKMTAEVPDAVAFAKSQRFKVVAKVLPVAVEAVAKAQGPHAAWSACDKEPTALDIWLSCDANGPVPAEATVRFEDDAASVAGSASPMSKDDPYAAAKKAAAARGDPNASKTVTFGAGGGGADEAHDAAQRAAPSKSSLKRHDEHGADESAQHAAAATTIAAATTAAGKESTPDQIVMAESDKIQRNTIYRQGLETAVKDLRTDRDDREVKIARAEQRLEQLNATTGASNKPQAAKKKGSRLPRVPLNVLLIVMILLYVGGAMVRVQVGDDILQQWAQTHVPAPLRSALRSVRESTAPHWDSAAEHVSGLVQTHLGPYVDLSGSSATSSEPTAVVNEETAPLSAPATPIVPKTVEKKEAAEAKKAPTEKEEAVEKKAPVDAKAPAVDATPTPQKATLKEEKPSVTKKTSSATTEPKVIKSEEANSAKTATPPAAATPVAPPQPPAAATPEEVKEVPVLTPSAPATTDSGDAVKNNQEDGVKKSEKEIPKRVVKDNEKKATKTPKAAEEPAAKPTKPNKKQ